MYPVSAESVDSVPAAATGAPTAVVDGYLHAENLVHILETPALYRFLEVLERMLVPVVAEL
jgi:hypothetical protein